MTGQGLRFRVISGLLVAAAAAFPLNATAFDPDTFSHSPPEISAAQADAKFLEVTIPGEGIARARILMARLSGMRVMAMEPREGSLTALLPFDDLGMVRYQFHIQDSDGAIHETEFYSVRRPGTSDREQSIHALEKRRNEERARARQLTHTLEVTLQTDPKSLEKRKNQELAQELVALGRKERELEQLKRGAR